MGQREKIRARRIKAKVQDRKKPHSLTPSKAHPSTHQAQSPAASVDSNKRSITYKGCKGAILVVGDGDFSFARGLVKHMGSGKGLTLTAYDSLATTTSKYSGAKENMAFITQAGGKVMHGVDATRLKATFPSQKFDRIIFNFPHSGEQRVHVNRALLHDFFERNNSRAYSCQDCLSGSGQVHVTLKMRPPYSEWGVEDRAKEAGFRLSEVLHFDQKTFPGYRHQTTEKDAKTFIAASAQEARLCKTFVFVQRATAAKAVQPIEEEGTAKNASHQAEAHMMGTARQNAEEVTLSGRKRGREEEVNGGQERQEQAKKAADKSSSESFWTADMLKALRNDLKSMSKGGHAEEWGTAAKKYAGAKDEEEIADADIDLIDPSFNTDEAKVFEEQGLGSLLGKLGEHIVKGSVPVTEDRPVAIHVPREEWGAASQEASAKKTTEKHSGLKTAQNYKGKEAVHRAANRVRPTQRLMMSCVFFRRSCRGSNLYARAMAFFAK